jgi:hypothetical protein
VLPASSLKEGGGGARRDAGVIEGAERTWRAQDGEKNSDREGATQSALEASVEAQSEPGAGAPE